MLPEVNYAELIFTHRLYAMLCWTFFTDSWGRDGKVHLADFQVDVNRITMFRVAVTDSATMLPRTKIFTLSPSVRKLRTVIVCVFASVSMCVCVC